MHVYVTDPTCFISTIKRFAYLARIHFELLSHNIPTLFYAPKETTWTSEMQREKLNKKETRLLHNFKIQFNWYCTFVAKAFYQLTRNFVHNQLLQTFYAGKQVVPIVYCLHCLNPDEMIIFFYHFDCVKKVKL